MRETPDKSSRDAETTGQGVRRYVLRLDLYARYSTDVDSLILHDILVKIMRAIIDFATHGLLAELLCRRVLVGVLHDADAV